MKDSPESSHKLNSIDPLPPADIAARILAIGVSKAQLSVRSLVLLGLLGGVYIGFGGALATLVLTDNSLGFGLSRFVAGIAFSLGLIMLVVGGGELYTGNNLMVVACSNRSISWSAAVRNWILIYPANAAGAIILAYAISSSGILEGGNVKTTAINIAEAKAQLSASSAFVRGILCNILVCMAVWMSTSARSVEGKAIAIMLPVGAFVALGFEHCIANFYLIPIGMLSGAQINLQDFVSNIAIVTAGNTLGGAFVAAAYYNVYLSAAHRDQLPPLWKSNTVMIGAHTLRLAVRLAIGLAGGSALAIISAGWLAFFKLSSF